MHSTSDKLSVIIPALNEEGIVGKTVKSIPKDELRKMGFETEIVVVDNGSTDRTAKEASEAGAKVIYEENIGYGNAYLRGLKEVNGDIIVMGDADGSHPLETIPEFIHPLMYDDVDMIIGSRYKGKINHGSIPKIHKYIGNPMLNFILNSLFHSNFSDAHCGMRAFKGELLNNLDLKSPGMEFAVEMIIETYLKGFKIKEIPIEIRERGAGKSKLRTVRDGFRHLKYIIKRKLIQKNGFKR